MRALASNISLMPQCIPMDGNPATGIGMSMRHSCACSLATTIATRPRQIPPRERPNPEHEYCTLVRISFAGSVNFCTGQTVGGGSDLRRWGRGDPSTSEGLIVRSSIEYTLPDAELTLTRAVFLLWMELDYSSSTTGSKKTPYSATWS